MAEIKNGVGSHKIVMEDREKLSVTGVSEVVSFDDETVRLKTSKGELDIDGTGLRISTLDTSGGIVTVFGNVNSLNYYQEAKKLRFGRSK